MRVNTRTGILNRPNAARVQVRDGIGQSRLGAMGTSVLSNPTGDEGAALGGMLEHDLLMAAFLEHRPRVRCLACALAEPVSPFDWTPTPTPHNRHAEFNNSS